MDLLNEADRRQLHQMLKELFGPIGTTDQFIILAFGRETRLASVHLQTPESLPYNQNQLLHFAAHGDTTDALELEF